ncbi:MAG: FkbM family methyltransferase [Bryobacterales bacterium]|nr:FkbM family methyltransferase [Bryobacterales bacterium]
MTSRPAAWAVLATGALVLLTGVVYLIPALRYPALVRLGRNYCPVDSALSAARQRAAWERMRLKLERAAWIVQRDRGLEQWDIGGERYWMPEGSRILPGMLAEQKAGIYDSAGVSVQPDDVVLDCGANIGLYTLSALARGAALVIAIEPALDNVECLRRNLAPYVAAGRVIVYPKGVWDKEDVLPLNVQPSNSGSYSVALRYRDAAPGPRVELTTIDELVRDLRLERVDYIKMNIEGAERAALEGGAEVIRKFRPRLTISLEHRYEDPRAIPEAVLRIHGGYRALPGRCVEISASLRPAVMSFSAAP